MATIRPFPCVLPSKDLASRVAALPYDVYNRAEAKEVALRDALSFLNIDRPESNLPDTVDIYDDAVYEKAKELFAARFADGTYVEEKTPRYYIYELIMDGRSQKGIVACSSIDDYENGIIKKHENVLTKKAQDRIRHIETLRAQTGPIFLAYHRQETLAAIIAEVMTGEKLFGFTSEDGITHNGWAVTAPEIIQQITDAFAGIDATYIADGHHRTESAVEVGRRMRAANPDYTGEEEFNSFLSVLFADDELLILPYYRVVKDLNGLTKDEFLSAVASHFAVEELGSTPFEPTEKGTFGMLLDGVWYQLTEQIHPDANDPVASLDVSLLQDYLLAPILGIGDPKTDERIDFIGGIRGIGALAARTKEDMRLAFSLRATSIQELFAVADAGRLMPPKSTWFEPKLRSGLFIHKI